ncbi:metallophosphoesterase family protein [uncultured Bacteroides sp.]|uniref:metallophosphoesterase family protein n=1 Tax=uncultured Bacteroides sp. TaxID=162156 RepID=UPI002632D12A|nr:metallophosphoesterase family protein [uncultured Bacteroides sp.]
MKILCVFLCLLCSILNLEAQNVLKFNKEGKFKIVQFTDVHNIYKDSRSQVSLQRIREVLTAERPDLVIITGDVIYGKPAEEGFREVLSLISEFKIPFGITFGNHDDEQGMSRQQLLDITSSFDYNLTSTAKGISGFSNYVLTVKSNDLTKDAAILYCLDSNSYSKIEGVKGYGFINHDQISWYRDNSKKFTTSNGGKPVQSFAFFHIPLPEYAYAVEEQSAVMVGTRMEPACSPKLNSGMFAAMKEMGDVRGVFVGHDHDNDYAVYWNKVLLAYGRYSGGNTVYNHLSNGARVIELSEDGTSFTTWITLEKGERINKVVCPDDFTKDKNKNM